MPVRAGEGAGVSVLVFDLDDTLFPEHQYVLSGFKAAGAWLEQHHGLSGFYPIAQQLFEAGTRGTIFNQALEQLGQPATLVPALVAAYREHMPAISLHEDARWALEHFKGSHQLGLITDGYLVTQRNKVEALGIRPYFDVLVFSDEHGRDCWKPSPVPYRKVMEALNAPGEACTYVGDNPSKDFVTARALGWNTVQITREGGEYALVSVEETHRAHHRIGNLYQLEDVLS